jgi:sulfur-oxidizing protein SoxX
LQGVRRLLLAVLAAVAAAPQAAERLVPYRVDADGISGALTQQAGDSERGRAIVVSRDSNCLLCHAVPDSRGRPMGDVGPPLAGVGARLTAAQIRLRIVDPARPNRESVMPSYYKVDGLQRVAAPYRERPILDAQQIEDVIAYLRTLQ